MPEMQWPGSLLVALAAAGAGTGLKVIETESDWVFPEAELDAVAVFVASDKMVCVLPSNVTDFAFNGEREPTLIPETISPETGTPFIFKFPSEEISVGIFAETLTLST